MLRFRLLKMSQLSLSIFLLLMSACSKEKAQDAGTQADVSAQNQNDEKKPSEQAAIKDDETLPLDTPPPLPAPRQVQNASVRPNAPIMLAQYTNGVIVPTGTVQANRWLAEELQTLDRLPEGVRGKDTRLDVVESWWNKLDIQDGDTFTLRGNKGAEGVFTVKREFATADRGSCVGLVWALPGETEWTVNPRGPTHWAAQENQKEYIWAFRGPSMPYAGILGRDLTDGEKASAERALRRIRYSVRKALPKPSGGDAWEECDSLSKEPCKNFRTLLFPIDIEGDARAEVIATIQFNSPPPKAGTAHPEGPVESRLLLGVSDKSGYLLGKWDGDSSKPGEEGRAPTFVGALDVTGDGRAELIFRRTKGEAENFQIYQASPEKAGRWHLLFQTQTEGC